MKVNFMNFRYCFLALLLSSSLSFSQSSVPTDYFAKPLDIPIILSGTFGELRNNHFHSGLDIKTQQRTGLPVMASAEGYISRINVAHFGYGKALYIQHPNGYTTVYAHLEQFSEKIEAYIKALQYKKESYEVEVYPQAGELPVTKEEIIAFSGNSGGSGGPHLHFEIRDGNARPMNPLRFGFDIKDEIAPEVKSIFAYPKGEESHVNGVNEMQKLRLIPLADGSYQTENFKAYGNIGFGVAAIDKLNYAVNQNGIYKLSSSVNGKDLFEMDFDRFSFGESRYINRFIDYEYYQNHKQRVQKMFTEADENLSMLKKIDQQGFVKVQDSLNYIVQINVEDFKGNKRLIRIPIETQKLPEEEIKTINTSEKTNYFAKKNQAIAFDEDGFDIYIPKGALYQDTYLEIKKEADQLQVHKSSTPLHYDITIGFDISQYNEEDKEKLFIARMSDWGTPYYSKTYKKKNRITTKTKYFGTYKLMQDHIPPTITPVNFHNKKWMSNYRYLKFKIDDNLSGISSYRATVNGKFILMEYDYKTNSLTHDFNDKAVTDTENNLKIIVVDNVGNNTTFEGTFFRKN